MGAERLVPPLERLLSKAVRAESGCLLWTGHLTRDGYGRMGYQGCSSVSVHRVAYLEQVGQIPAGMHIDHTCHTNDPSCGGGSTCIHRRCIELSHLECVLPGENARRGRSFATSNASKSNCPAGHPYDDANTIHMYGRRYCRACTYIRSRAYKARKRATNRRSS